MTEVLPKTSEFLHRFGNWGELRTTITTTRANVYWVTYTKLVLSILYSSNHLYNNPKLGIIIIPKETDKKDKEFAQGHRAIKPFK